MLKITTNMEALAITGLTIAGRSLFGKVIYDTYDLMKDATNHPAVNAVLTEIDLESDLEVIEALVKQISDDTEIKDDKSPLSICLHGVCRMVHMIRDELKLITPKFKIIGTLKKSNFYFLFLLWEYTLPNFTTDFLYFHIIYSFKHIYKS